MPEFTMFSQGTGGPMLYFCADRGEAEQVFDGLARRSRRPFRMAAFTVADWNRDLSPWPAPAVFGNQDFAGQAAETLRWLTDTCIPRAEETPAEARAIGGYSLAGLFSLWAFYETGLFQGAASCSGSLWYPGWPEYAQKKNAPPQGVLYLSLGEKEPLTRNRVMAQVGDATRAQHALALSQGLDTALAWHPGGHFQEPEQRTAQGFAWLLERLAN